MITPSLPERNKWSLAFSPLTSWWTGLPVLLKSVFNGLFVFIILSSGATSLFIANMAIFPSIPWSVPVILLYLWVVFQFFNGRWGTRASSPARQQSMRARRLGTKEWGAAWSAIIPVMIFFIAVTIVSYRLIEVPSEELLPSDMPWWSVYSTLLMISIIAGVSEEAGFRGYIQAPLEKRYGPWFAISVASVLFWLAHLNHANGVPRVLALFIMGASLGALALCARSILPAIIAHAAADTIVFMGSVSGIGPDYLWIPVPIKESGMDGFFWVTIGVVIISGIASAVTLRRLSAITLLIVARDRAAERESITYLFEQKTDRLYWTLHAEKKSQLRKLIDYDIVQSLAVRCYIRS